MRARLNFLGQIAVVIMLLSLPDPARAQSAGQHSREMNDIAATPPQGSGGDGPRPYSEPAYQYDVRPSKQGVAAVAYHADTGSVWMSSGHKTLDRASARALDGCNAATGGGCHIAATLAGEGFIFFSQDAMGQFWIKEEARAYGKPSVYDLSRTNPSQEYCRANSFGCTYVTAYHSGHIYLDEPADADQSQDIFPKGKLVRNRFALVARPADASAEAPGQGKSWLISGRENSAAARKEVLDRCRADAGAPCAIAAYAVNGTSLTDGGTAVARGVLVHFVDARGRSRWTSAAAATGKKQKKGQKGPSDPVTAEQRLAQLCPPKLPCRLIATYDAATPRMQVIEDIK